MIGTDFRPDRLDKAAFAAIIAFCASVVILSIFFRSGEKDCAVPADGFGGVPVQKAKPADLEARIKQIKDLINGGGNPDKAQALINGSLAAYPYEG